MPYLLNMKNKVIAQKLQLQTMSAISHLLQFSREGDITRIVEATGLYCSLLQKIVDLVDMPCGKPNCGYFSCKEEMCDRMEMESREVANDQ